MGGWVKGRLKKNPVTGLDGTKQGCIIRDPSENLGGVIERGVDG